MKVDFQLFIFIFKKEKGVLIKMVLIIILIFSY